MAKKNEKRKQTRPQSIRLPANREPAEAVPAHSQSQTEAIRRRLSSIENNFHILDEQLDQLESRLEVEPLLKTDDQKSPAPKPR